MNDNPLTPAALGGFVKMAVDAVRAAFPALGGGRAQFLALVISLGFAGAIDRSSFVSFIGWAAGIFTAAVTWNETSKIATRAVTKTKTRKEESRATDLPGYTVSPGEHHEGGGAENRAE